MHTVTWGTMEPTERGDAGYQQGGQVPGKKGWRNKGKEAWLSKASPHTVLHASHTTQFPLSESLSCALFRAQEVESFLASNHDLAVSAGVSWEQAAAMVQSPESGKKCSQPPHTCPLFHHHRFIICIILIPFLLDSPAFPCETSSEMPLLELITLSWQLEFSKFNYSCSSPLHELPFPNSHLLPHVCFFSRHKTWEKIGPTSPPG